MYNVLYIGIIVALFVVLVATSLAKYDSRVTISPEELIARTIHFEAGCESVTGKLAVASVIYNRHADSADSWQEIILAKAQFSCWNGPQDLCELIPGSEAALCRSIAHDMLTGEFEPIGPWTHYYNPNLCDPSWAKSLQKVKNIGRHRFGVL